MSGSASAEFEPIASWSNVCKTRTRLVPFASKGANALSDNAPLIARGNGNSFGDAAFVTEATTVCAAGLDEIGPLDAASESIECGAGVTVLELQRRLEPFGYHFPVYGGTQRATIGGAIASDIHGKNQFAVGSFGNHVRELTLLTANGDSLRCSPARHTELFHATIGGMGLTGFVTSARLAVRARPTFSVRVSVERVTSIANLLEALGRPRGDFSVCDWFEPARRDLSALVYSGDYVMEKARDTSGLRLSLPLPRWNAFRRPVVRALSLANERASRWLPAVTHVNRFNYGGPHEFVAQWNRLFGKAGFFEYHFGVPANAAADALAAFATEARRRDLFPVFGCVKPFGDIAPVGVLSFCRPGIGVNVQLAANAESPWFLRWFNDYLAEVGGRIYLAKDAVLSAAQFRALCPELEAFEAVLARIDPKARFQSDLSRRLGLKRTERREPS